jgi:hypothetical protein
MALTTSPGRTRPRATPLWTSIMPMPPDPGAFTWSIDALTLGPSMVAPQRSSLSNGSACTFWRKEGMAACTPMRVTP